MNKSAANDDAEDRLLSAKELAQKLGISRRQIDRLRNTQQLPKPLEIGSLLRWDPHVITRWIEAGCPGHNE